MRNLLLLLAVVLLAATACQNTDGNKTKSGFKYEHHVANNGAKPKPGEFVSFHVQMRNQDSIVFQSRVQPQVPQMQIPQPPAEGAAEPRVSPLTEALELMAVGDSLTLYYPIDTLPQKPRNFENTDFVIYDLVTTKIMSAEEYQAEQDVKRQEEEAKRKVLQEREVAVAEMTKQTAKDYLANKLGDKLQTTASGLKYVIHEQGDGKKAEGNVKVNYYGTLTDGERFDDSFSRGVPFAFPLGAGRVIRGWDEGIALLNEGGKATLFVPAELGYGAAGSPPKIPGGAELVFYVEVEEVQ